MVTHMASTKSKQINIIAWSEIAIENETETTSVASGSCGKVEGRLMSYTKTEFSSGKSIGP